MTKPIIAINEFTNLVFFFNEKEKRFTIDPLRPKFCTRNCNLQLLMLPIKRLDSIYVTIDYKT